MSVVGGNVVSVFVKMRDLNLFFGFFDFVREFVEEANKASMRINEYLHVR